MQISGAYNQLPAAHQGDSSSRVQGATALTLDHPAAMQPASVMRVLEATDDHLQGLMHYSHSRDLREAMSTVSQMQEVLAHLVRWHDQLKPEDIRRAKAILAKATAKISAAA